MTSYAENHLKQWLINHECINLACVAKAANLNDRDLSYFLKNKRNLKIDEYFNVIKILENYGFVPLNDE